MTSPEAPQAGPLAGRRIVITRAPEDAARLADRLRALGAEPVMVPAIEIRLADPAELDAALSRLAEYDWIVFTSRNAVRAVFERTDRLEGPAVAVVGPATARALEAHGVTPLVVPAVHRAEALLEAMGEVRDRRILFVRGSRARRVLPDGLSRRGAIVDEVVAYETSHSRGRSLPDGVDAITFTSGSAVEGFLAAGAVPPRARIVCLGPVTADAAREWGLTISAVAEPSTEDGLVAALLQLFEEGS